MPIIHFEDRYLEREHDNFQQLVAVIEAQLANIRDQDKQQGVAVVFSVTNTQAEELHMSCSTGHYSRRLRSLLSSNPLDTVRHLFSNKANVQSAKCLQLIDVIEEKNWQNCVHILPIATSMRGGEDKRDNRVDVSLLHRDMHCIYEYLKNDWSVITLTNPEHLKDANKQQYLIGGQIDAINFYRDTDSNLVPYQQRKAPRGIYVRNILNAMKRRFDTQSSDDGQLLIQELGVPTISPLTLSHFVSFYIREALRALSDLPESYIRGVIGASISPSYCLRIHCVEDSKVMKKIEKVLALSYGAKNLKEHRHKIIIKDYKISHVGSQDNYISINFDNVYRFLTAYCGIPINTLKSIYQAAFKERGHGEKNIAISGDYITVTEKNGVEKEFSLDEFIGAGKAAQSSATPKGIHQQIKYVYKGEVIHPEQCHHAVSRLMNDIKKADSKPYPSAWVSHEPNDKKPLYRYLPIINDERLEFSEKLWQQNTRIIASILKTNHEKPELSKELAQNLHRQVVSIYNSLSSYSWYLYSELFHEMNELGPSMFLSNKAPESKRLQANKFGQQITNHILIQISCANKAEGLVNYWIYSQVALLSYLKGNYFLLNSVFGGLDVSSYRTRVSDKFAGMDYVFEFLNPFKDADGIKLSQQLYFEHYGTCIPVLYPYEKHAEFESARAGVEGINSKGKIEAEILKSLGAQLNELDVNFSMIRGQLSFARLAKRIHMEAPDGLFKPQFKKDYFDDVPVASILSALECHSVYQRFLNGAKDMSKFRGLKLDKVNDETVLLNTLEKRSDFIKLNIDGREHTALGLAIQKGNLPLAEELLFSTLTKLNPMGDGAEYLDAILTENPHGEEFSNNVRRLLALYSIKQSGANLTNSAREGVVASENQAAEDCGGPSTSDRPSPQTQSVFFKRGQSGRQEEYTHQDDTSYTSEGYSCAKNNLSV